MQPIDKSRAQRIWESDSESAESETNDASHNEESDLPPSDSEPDLPKTYKKHPSWRIRKTKNIPERVFADICHGKRALPDPIEHFRKYFDDEFLNTLSDKAISIEQPRTSILRSASGKKNWRTLLALLCE